jgi:hypothetical protein
MIAGQFVRWAWFDPLHCEALTFIERASRSLPANAGAGVWAVSRASFQLICQMRS